MTHERRTKLATLSECSERPAVELNEHVIYQVLVFDVCPDRGYCERRQAELPIRRRGGGLDSCRNEEEGFSPWLADERYDYKLLTRH